MFFFLSKVIAIQCLLYMKKRESEGENILLYLAVGSPATSPHPKTSYISRIRQAPTTQLLEKSSPELLHRVIVLPSSITKSKIIKFGYLASAQENKNRFLEADIVRNKWWQTAWWQSRKKRFTSRKQKNYEKQSYPFSSHFHRRGNFYCNPYSTQGGERRCQGEQLHFSFSTPSCIPYQEGETGVSKQSGPGDWLIGHWTSESTTRPSSCFSSTCRWSPFSCQLLSFLRGCHGLSCSFCPLTESPTGKNPDSASTNLSLCSTCEWVCGAVLPSSWPWPWVQVCITNPHCKLTPIYTCQDWRIKSQALLQSQGITECIHRLRKKSIGHWLFLRPGGKRNKEWDVMGWPVSSQHELKSYPQYL